MTADEFVAERVRELVAAAPPLPDEARAAIRRLMRPAPGEAALASVPERAA